MQKVFVVVLCSLFVSFTQVEAKPSKPGSGLEAKVQGEWVLKELKCNGAVQSLGKLSYVLSFNGKEGAYISKLDACTQVEPEIYNYISDSKISIKSGVRKCEPNPCQADLTADQCGKETNTSVAHFDVAFKDSGKEKNKIMTLLTSDPKAIDCTGPGQSKPALLTFEKK